MGSHEHSTESELLDHNHLVQHSRDATGYSPTPSPSDCETATDRPQDERKMLLSVCRTDEPVLSAYAVTDTEWQRDSSTFASLDQLQSL